MRVSQGWLRILHFGPEGALVTVVLHPGLCLPRYTVPTARRLAQLGMRCLVVDALAWRARGPRIEPTVPALAAAGAVWLLRIAPAGPVVLVGHSTGAQVALEAALLLQDGREDISLVMAGPTFRPEHRKVPGLARAALTAYRRDSPRELTVVRDLAKVRLDVASIVQSAQRHVPDERVAGLRVPLTVTAGVADTFAPASWLSCLAEASGSPSAVRVLPGSHNNLFTHPHEFAAVVTGSLPESTG
jgi:pimeloyl-ACP methyl ester carboxylesterase